MPFFTRTPEPIKNIETAIGDIDADKAKIIGSVCIIAGALGAVLYAASFWIERQPEYKDRTHIFAINPEK